MIAEAVDKAFAKRDEARHSAGTVSGNEGDARARMIERLKADSRGPVGTTAADFPDDDGGGNYRADIDAGAPTPDTDARSAREKMIADMAAASRGH